MESAHGECPWRVPVESAREIGDSDSANNYLSLGRGAQAADGH